MKIRNHVFILFLVTLLGVVVRAFNISPYTFYPDSYQNLLLTENIITKGSVIGELGEQGIIYPPYFSWTRSFYPILIFIVNIFVENVRNSATLVAFITGVLSIPLSFLLTYKISNSIKHGLFTTAILATSFNHTVWGGFIFSETTGVLVIITTLILLFHSFKQKEELFNLWQVAFGVVYALAVFTRYEYILLVIPLLYFIWNLSQNKILFLINSLTGLFLISLIYLALIYPVYGLISAAKVQVFEIITATNFRTLISLFLLFIIFFYIRRKNRFLKNLTFFGLFLIVVIAIIDITFSLNVIPAAGLYNSISNDILLFSFTLIGIIYLLQSNEKLSYGFILSLIILFIIYFRVNPLMQRYLTHLIPFQIIFAGYGAAAIYDIFKNRFSNLSAISLFIIIFALQTAHTLNGIRLWDNGLWFQKSYEEESALQLKNIIDEDDVIFVSSPEAYYFFTHHTTLSVTQSKENVFLNKLSDNQKIVFVNDQGMKTIFPEFSDFLDEKLSEYYLSEYEVNRPYAFTSNIYDDYQKVKLYRTTKRNFIDKISSIK